MTAREQCVTLFGDQRWLCRQATTKGVRVFALMRPGCDHEPMRAVQNRA